MAEISGVRMEGLNHCEDEAALQGKVGLRGMNARHLQPDGAAHGPEPRACRS